MTPEDFLCSFPDEVKDLADRRLLTWNHFLDGSWNQYSWLHARMFGALVRAVKRPFVPMVEVFWNRQFHPDVCLADQQDTTIGVFEYESTNSSDERDGHIPFLSEARFNYRVRFRVQGESIIVDKIGRRREFYED